MNELEILETIIDGFGLRANCVDEAICSRNRSIWYGVYEEDDFGKVYKYLENYEKGIKQSNDFAKEVLDIIINFFNIQVGTERIEQVKFVDTYYCMWWDTTIDDTKVIEYLEELQ